jgi:hypothetical protein
MRGRGIICTAVFGVVMARDVVDMDGVRGDVGDLSESAVLLRVKAKSSSFSEIEWRRGDRRREGEDDMLDASLMSVGASVDISVSASESVPEEDASLADDADDGGRRGRSSEGDKASCETRATALCAIDPCLCSPNNRCIELYTRAKGYNSTHNTPVTTFNTNITPLIAIFCCDRSWRDWSYFSLYPTVPSCPLSTCRRLNTGSARLTNSLSSLSDE